LTAQLFLTCLTEQFFPSVLDNMVKILEKVGVPVEVPYNQTCCGQPFYNSGFHNEARETAQKWIETFYPREGWIISPSGSCVDMIRHHYPELFPKDSIEYQKAVELSERTYEFCDFLVNKLKITDVGGYFPFRVTYHASCHLLRGLGISTEPKKLLDSVDGIALIPLQEEEACCGFGGVFSVIFPEISRSMMNRKISNILAANVDVVTACDAGCLMNIGGGLRQSKSQVRAVHIIDILASEMDTS
jgi:L-lactate dehydrogenase complex protein LldE